MSDQSANVPSTTIEYLQRVLQELGLHATFQTLTEELSLLQQQQQQQQQCRSVRNHCSSNPPPSDQNTLPYHADVQSLRTLLLCPWETQHKTSFSASPQLDASSSQLGHESEVVAGALRGACQWIGAALASPLEVPVNKKNVDCSHHIPLDECLTLLQFFFSYAKEATCMVVDTKCFKATTTEGHNNNKNQEAVKEERETRWMDAALCEVSRWNSTIAATSAMAKATSTLAEQEAEGPDHMRDANAFSLPGAVRSDSSDPARVGLASNVTAAAAASSSDSSTDRLLRLLAQVLRHALTRSCSSSSFSSSPVSRPTSRSDETSNEEEGVTAPNISATATTTTTTTTTTKRRAKAAAAKIRAQLPSLTELHHATRSLLALTQQDGQGQQQSDLSGGLRGVVGAADGGGGSAGSTLEVRATIGCEVLLALEATIDQSIQRSFLSTATESSSITKQGGSLRTSCGRQTSSTAAIDSEATNLGLDVVNEEEERRRLLLFRQNRLLLEDVWRVLFRIALKASFSEQANSSNATTTATITAQRIEEHLLRCLVIQFTSKAMAVCSYYAKTTVSSLSLSSALSSAALRQDGRCGDSLVPRRPASSSAGYWHYWEEKYRRNENVEDRGDDDAGHHRHAAATIAADLNKTVGVPRPAQELGKKRQRSSVALNEGSLRQSQRSTRRVETTKNESKRRPSVDLRRPAAAPMLLAACSPSVPRVAALLSSTTHFGGTLGLNQKQEEKNRPQQHRIEVLQVHYDETSSRLWLLTSEGQLISTSSGGGGGAQDKGNDLTVHMTVPPSLFRHLPHSSEDRTNLNNNNKGPKQTGKRDQQQEQLLPNSRSFSSCLSYLPLWGPSLIQQQQQPNQHPSSRKHDVVVGGIAAFFVEEDDDDGGNSSGGSGVASRDPQTVVDRRRHSALLHLFVHHHHHQRQQQQPTHCTMKEEQQEQQVRHDGSQPQKSRCEGKARVSLVIRPPTSSLCHPRNWTIRSVNVIGDERANDVSSTASNNNTSAVVAVLTHRQACEREDIRPRTTSHAEAEEETKEQSNVSFGNSTSSLCNGDDVSLRELLDLSSSQLRGAAATARHPRDSAALQSWPIVQCCALFPLPIASSSSSASLMNTKRSGTTEDAEGDDARNSVAPNSQAVGLLVALSTNMVLQFRVELSFSVGTLEAPNTAPIRVVVSLTKVFGGLAASVHSLVPVPWLNAFATLDGANRLLLYSLMSSSSNEDKEEAAECFMESAVAPSPSGSALRSSSPLTEILMTSRGPQWATSSDSFHRSAAGEQQNRPVADAARVAELAQHFLGPVGPRFVTKSRDPALPTGNTEHLSPSLLERVLWERDLHQDAEDMRHHGPQYQLSGSSNNNSRRTSEKLGPRCVCAPPTTRFNFTPLLQQSILQCRGLDVRDEVSHGGQQTAPPYHLLQLTSSATLRPPSPSSSSSSRLDRSFPVTGGRFLALTVAVEHTRAITYQMEHPSRLVPGFYAVVVIDLQNGSLRSITPVAALDDPLGILETRRWAHRNSNRHGSAAEQQQQQQQHPKPILMLPLQFVWLGDPPFVDVASVSEKQNQRSATMLAPPPLHKKETRSRHTTSSRLCVPPPVGEDNGNPQTGEESGIGVAVGLTRRAIGLLDVTDGGSFRTFLLDGGMSSPLPLLDTPNQQESIAASPTEKSSLLKPSTSTSTSVSRLHGTWWWRSACCHHSHPEKEGASFLSTSTVCRYAASDPYWHQVQCDAKKAEEEQKRLHEERCRTQRTQGGARWLASRASKDFLSSLFRCVPLADDATQQATGSGTIAREVDKTTMMKKSEMDRLRESQNTMAARLFTVEEVQQKLRDERAMHHHHRSSLYLTSNKKRAREDDEVDVDDDDAGSSRELEPSLRSSSYWRHVFDRLLLFQQQQRNRKDEPQPEATPERAKDAIEGRRSLPRTEEAAPASRSAEALTTPSSSSLIQRSVLNPLNGRPNPQLPRHTSDDEAAASQSGSGGGCVGGDEEHVRWRVGVANDFTFCWWRGPQSSSVASSWLSAVPSVIIADDEGNVIVQPLHSSA